MESQRQAHNQGVFRTLQLIGAYFAGALMPPGWVRRLQIEAVGTFSLIWLAPIFFGHSGLRIDGDAPTWPSAIVSLRLMVIIIVTKILPSGSFRRHRG